jgi:ParB-like chromosome segregation protein Spo0J
MSTVVNTATGEIVDGDVINYRIHPVADIFPLIEGREFAALVEDIRANGQMEPVVLDSEGQLIDGRNRARACQALGIDVKETRYTGDDVAVYIVSHNLHRRHLTDAQRAMVAARLANLPPEGGRPKTSPDGEVSVTALRRSRSC